MGNEEKDSEYDATELQDIALNTFNDSFLFHKAFSNF